MAMGIDSATAGERGAEVILVRPETSPDDMPGILRAAAQHNHANVGVYASVLRGGQVRRGDAIRLE